ncbi:hypothetical protein BDB01DRAFT_249114 [Pilobolus umbonatus]|nr:hypothetical protein BDB01DRAFT_249114 [Pilobolus umbonatus]
MESLEHSSVLMIDSNMNRMELSFVYVSNRNIINTMGVKQLESYQRRNRLKPGTIYKLRSLCQTPDFTYSNNALIEHILTTLRKAYSIGNLDETRFAIKYMKNAQMMSKVHRSTLDYLLLDMLEHIIETCLGHKEHTPYTYWYNIFTMLFRGTHIKLTNHNSVYADDCSSTIDTEKILFQCVTHDVYGKQKHIEISSCEHTNSSSNTENTILQSKLICINQSILCNLMNECKDVQDIFPIGIHLDGYSGYLFSIKPYRDIYVASQICDHPFFLPLTMAEFELFIHEGRMLEMLCNLREHYKSITKFIRQSNRDKSSWVDHV